MTKVRPCKKACGYPAEKGRQFCAWHILMRSSSDIQADVAREWPIESAPDGWSPGQLARVREDVPA